MRRLRYTEALSLGAVCFVALVLVGPSVAEGVPWMLVGAGVFVGLVVWAARREGVPTDASLEGATVDLAAGKCGESRLGEAPAASEPWYGSQQALRVRSPSGAVEVEVDEGVLVAITIFLKDFAGTLCVHGESVEDSGLTEAGVTALLGQAWWRDEDEDEVLLFYEHPSFELQCEFEGKRELTAVVLATDALMALEVQRQRYGVDKPWPPETYAGAGRGEAGE